MRKTNIGGSALIEGIMMLGGQNAAIAVRKPDGEIVLDKKTLPKRSGLYKMPVIRGVLSFGSQMILSTKAIMYSASFIDIEEEKEQSGLDIWLDRFFGDRLKDAVIYFSLVLSLGFSIGLFILLPNILAGFLDFGKGYMGAMFYNAFEGVVRITLFIGYLYLASMTKDMRRIWEYHGAEHKTINCYESGEELTVENVMKHSTKNLRCSTSFLFFVMLVSILLFALVGWYSVWMNVLLRLLLIPLVAGLSFELFLYSGRKSNWFTKIITVPGLMFQRLTTKEPDERQVEVAISAFIAVL